MATLFNILNNNYTKLYSTYSSKVLNLQIIEIINSIKDSNNFNIAITHKSYVKAYPNFKSYEELVPHGEKILETFISKFLEDIYTDFTEEQLNDIKLTLINDKILKEISNFIKLDKYIKLRGGKKTGPIMINVFKSFIAALYIEKGPVLLFEFLTLTVLNDPVYTKKIHQFNINNVPLISIDLENSQQIIESVKIEDNIEMDNNLEKSEELNNIILNRLNNIERKIEDQSNNIDNSFSIELNKLNNSLDHMNLLVLNLNNRLEIKDENVLNNTQISNETDFNIKVNKELDSFTLTNMIKGGLMVFTILLALVLFFSFVMYIFNSGILFDDSFIQLIRKFINDIGNKEIKDISTVNNPLMINKEINEMEDIRSLYVINEIEEYGNIEENSMFDENIEVKKEDGAFKNYLSFILVSIFLYFLQSLFFYGILNFPGLPDLGDLSRSDRVDPLNTSERISITERHLNPTIFPDLMDKFKEIFNIGIDYFKKLNEKQPIELVSANLIGIISYLLDELENPILPTDDSYDDKLYENLDDFNTSNLFQGKEDILNYDSPFDNPNIDIESFIYSDYDSDSDTDSENSSGSDSVNFIEQTDQSTQTELTLKDIDNLHDSIDNLQGVMSNQQSIIINQNTTIDQTGDIILELQQGLSETKDSITYRDGVIYNQGVMIDGQCNSIRLLENEVENLKENSHLIELENLQVKDEFNSLKDKTSILKSDSAIKDQIIINTETMLKNTQNMLEGQDYIIKRSEDMKEYLHNLIKESDSRLSTLYNNLEENRQNYIKDDSISMPRYIKNKLTLLEEYVKVADFDSIAESFNEANPDKVLNTNRENVSSNTGENDFNTSTFNSNSNCPNIDDID